MKRTSLILSLLVVSGIAHALSLQKPQLSNPNLSHNSSEVDLNWKEATTITAPQILWYRLEIRRWYYDSLNHPETYDTTSVEVQDDGHGNGAYTDKNLLPCTSVTYRVTAFVLDKFGVNVGESLSSDPVYIQIKGGVNAVVIFPTPKTVAVASSPLNVQVDACDAKDSAPITYSIISRPSIAQTMTINSSTGLLHWDVPANIPAGDTVVTVKAKDDEGASATHDIEIHLVPLVPLPDKAVSGNVAFIGGASVPVLVVLHPTDINVSVATTYIDTVTGTFSFPQVKSGSYHLSYIALIPGVIPTEKWYVDATTIDSATLFTVATDSITLDTIKITLPVPIPPLAIVGFVKNGTAGIEGATVQAFEVSGFINVPLSAGAPKIVLASTASTAADGSFYIPVVAGGSYMLLASAPGYQSRFLTTDSSQCASPFCASVFSPTKDTVPAQGTLAPADTSGQQIVGTVTSVNDSRGVQAMILFLKSIDGTITSGYSGGLVPFDVVTSDRNGNYSIPSVPKDTTGKAMYMIQAVPFDTYIPSYHAANDSARNMLLWEHALPFSLNTTKTDPLEIDVHVQPLTSSSGTISGHVDEQRATGTTSSTNAYVYAIDETSLTPEGYAFTNGSGDFSISNLPAGTYELWADKIPFHYALEGEIVIQGSDSGKSAGHKLLLTPAPTAVVEDRQPSTLRISSAYPNPFSERSIIAVVGHGARTLKLFDVYGREVADLTSQIHSGTSIVVLDGTQLPAGTYFAEFRDIEGVISRPLIVTH